MHLERVAPWSALGGLWRRYARRPIVDGRDGFVVYDGSGITGGRAPGAVVRLADGPEGPAESFSDLIGQGKKGTAVQFSLPGGALGPSVVSDDRGEASLSPHLLDGAVKNLDPRLGGLFDVGAQIAQGSAPAHVLALPADYDGPIFVSDVDDTLRPTSNGDLIIGRTQEPIYGVADILQGVAQRRVPIVYLSAGPERLHEVNEKFLAQLPSGILLERGQTGLKDLDPNNAVQTRSQADYKIDTLRQLQAAYPRALFYGIGDDRYGDAIAYSATGTRAYIHNVKPDQENVPSGFQGVITDDFTPEFRARVLGDLDHGLRRSVSFGGNPGAPVRDVPVPANPPPIPRESLADRLGHKLDLLHGEGNALHQSLQHHRSSSADALAFAQARLDADLARTPAPELAAVAGDLLRAQGKGVDRAACQAQFVRFITSHGRDAAHVDAILSRVTDGWNASRVLEGEPRLQFQALEQANRAVPGDWDGWDRYMDAVTSTQARPGTRVEPLIDGSQAWPVLLDAVDHARDSIDFSVFAFQSDQAGWDFAHHLADAADRGCRVRLLYDPVGSAVSNHAPTDPAIYDYLRQHGAEVIAQQLTALAGHVTHRKIMVVDGATGFIGGMNVGDEYRDVWHDVHSRVTGPGVADLQRLFVDQWQADGGTLADLPSLFPPLGAQSGGGPARMVGHKGRADATMKLAYLRAIDTAAKSVNIADPYFSDADVVAHLAAAAKRGVQVSLVLPHTNNHALEQAAERAQYQILADAGVRIYEFRGRPMAHDKVATFDGQLATIGSSNLDARSLVDNDEANVWSRDPALAARLDRDLFARDEQASQPITQYRPGMLGSAVEAAAWKIAPGM